MNSTSNTVGLSARQKINFSFNKFLWGLLILFLLLVASTLSTSGQKKELKTAPPKSSKEPKIDIKVNRHYDNKGNIIGYDSTYSSYYSSVEGDTIGLRSKMRKFDQYFNGIKPFRFDRDRDFGRLFFNDTILRPHISGRDFFLDDYFQRSYKLGDNFFKDMMQELDSIRNRFHRQKL